MAQGTAGMAMAIAALADWFKHFDGFKRLDSYIGPTVWF